jgi:integrase
MEPGNLQRHFKAVLVRSGLLATIRYHDLRHSCATLLLAQGVPLVVVRDTLGHTQISTTADIYGHVLLETHRQAVGALDALLAMLPKATKMKGRVTIKSRARKTTKIAAHQTRRKVWL